MTDEQADKVSRRIEWLTPDPITGKQVVCVYEEGGIWHVTPHWALVNGRAILAGLDIRSFDEPYILDPTHPDGGTYGEREPVSSDGLNELTQRVLRAISISQVRDTSRKHMAAQMTQHAEGISAAYPGAPAARSYEEAATSLTILGRPRRRRPAVTEALLRRVAELYTAAVVSGSKTPVREVEEQLRREGAPVSARGGRAQVRKWVQRARERGHLPPAH